MSRYCDDCGNTLCLCGYLGNVATYGTNSGDRYIQVSQVEKWRIMEKAGKFWGEFSYADYNFHPIKECTPSIISSNYITPVDYRASSTEIQTLIDAIINRHNESMMQPTVIREWSHK